MKKYISNIWYDTAKVYDDYKLNTMLSSFVVWFCVFFAFLFPLFGIGLAFFVSCFLCVGFKKNVIDCLQKKQVKIESVFKYYKYCLTCFCLKICTLVLSLLWGLLFVIPGLVVFVNYSFAPYILAENPKLGTIECLNKSKDLVYGYRAELFLIYLMEILFFVVLELFFSSLIMILNYFMVLPLWFNMLLPFALTLFVYFVFILPYFELAIGNKYLQIKPQITPLKEKKSKSVSKV